MIKNIINITYKYFSISTYFDNINSKQSFLNFITRNKIFFKIYPCNLSHQITLSKCPAILS